MTESGIHAWEIPAREYARHEARRGRRFAYETLDPRTTALIVIDMVGFFVEESARCQAIVPPINAMAEALRAAGGTVAWVLPTVEPPSPWAIEFYGEAIAARYAASGGEGSLAERLWEGLRTHPDDLWVQKSASSAFFPGRSPLSDLLAARGVETVLIAGTVTNVCCEASARDAATLGYRTIMLADANAGVNDASHNATLTTIYRSYGDVRPVADVIRMTGSRTLDHIRFQ
ncbi:MAG: isochorismatase family cysteine hydrolase [Thermomicrobiales bacterium]